MSHFTVLVISPDELTHDRLKQLLQPFHEFECTGQDDEYVVDVDQTEEAKSLYESHTTPMVRLADGGLVHRYDDRFYRDPEPHEASKIGLGTGCGNGLAWSSRDWGDGRGYRAKVHHIPTDCVEVDVPTREVESFADFIEGYYRRQCVQSGATPDLTGEHKYGYYTVDDHGNVLKIIDRTNPNKKWDWWTVGGRWSGILGAPDITQIKNIPQPLKPTFAVLKDGVWRERGQMGWWAVVHDAKEPSAWEAEFASLVDGLGPETWVALVDCHI